MRLTSVKPGTVLATSGLALWAALTPFASAAQVEHRVSGGSTELIEIRADPPMGADQVTPLATGKKVLTLGDSWAAHMEAGMRVAAPGTTIIGRAAGGCGIRFTVDNFTNDQGYSCNQWPTRWPQMMDEHRPDAVLVMVARWDAVQHKTTWDAPPRDLTDPGERQQFTDNLDRALDILSVRNTPVYLMNTSNNDPSSKVMNEVIEGAGQRHANVHVLNLRDQLCTANDCPRQLRGIAVYDPTWHTTPEVDKRLGAWILNQMFQPDYQG